jgi:hypothetical protein
MKKQINDLLLKMQIGENCTGGTANQLLDLFVVSKRELLESIIEDMDGKHPEYHREIVEDYLDDFCQQEK